MEKSEIKHITLAIADDHSLFRKGLVALLEDFGFVHRIYEASNGLELLDVIKCAETLPEIVLLDLRMPVMDGVETTEKLKELYPEIKIVILTMQDDESLIIHLIEKGINGYLLKNVEPEELEKALLTLMRKDYYFNQKLSEIVMKGLFTKGRKPSGIFYESLFTERELEVLRLICEEYTNAEIADKLNVSRRTIESHRNNLIEKSGVKNAAGLVVYAIRNGIYKI